MATLVIWHGYLLGGTGSNIYSKELVEAWTLDGHDVILMCQDPHPEQHPAIHEWIRVSGTSEVARRTLRPPTTDRPGTCTMVQADIGDLLPVFLVDRYPGFDRVERFIEADPKDVEHWVQANADAMKFVLDQWSVDGALINHVVMGPPAVGPVLEAAGVPYAVKVHGSELEYCIAADVLEGTAQRSGFDVSGGEGRFHAPGRQGLSQAASVLVGSEHIARRTVELLGSECVGERMRVAPPGVDIERFTRLVGTRSDAIGRLVEVVSVGDASHGRPADTDARVGEIVGEHGADREQLLGALLELAGSYDDRCVEQAATDRLRELDPTDPVIVFVGKLIRQKGVHLLIAALPLVLHHHPNARLIFAGFGRLREGLATLAYALQHSEWDVVRTLAAYGGQLDDGGAEALDWLESFIEQLQADPVLEMEYERAAKHLDQHLINIGLVGHDVLRELWPLATASVVPSVAAEAFGMVAAEAASCGAIPVVARHSGLADVASAFAEDLPHDLAELISFPVGPSAVFELAQRLISILDLEEARRESFATTVRTSVGSRWSWTAVAADAVDAMCSTPTRK